MKNVLFACLAFVLFGCKDAVTVEEKTLDIESDKVTEIVEVEQDRVAVFDYDGLEKELLNRKDDTTYVVNFWATWCKPCVKELPYFERLGSEYEAENVKVVLVTLDFPENLTKLVIPFMDKHELQSEVILLDDTNAHIWIPKVSEKWQGSIPATLIFNNDDRKFYERQFTYEELENEVKSIL